MLEGVSLRRCGPLPMVLSGEMAPSRRLTRLQLERASRSTKRNDQRQPQISASAAPSANSARASTITYAPRPPGGACALDFPTPAQQETPACTNRASPIETRGDRVFYALPKLPNLTRVSAANLGIDDRNWRIDCKARNAAYALRDAR